MAMLASLNYELRGKDCVIIGASKIVGRPMSMELLNAGATVLVCHKETKEIAEKVKMADVVIVAAGAANLVKADLMVILTNQSGFFDKNPDKYDDAKLIKKCAIQEVDINNFSSDEKSEFGTGGFKTKLQAVKMISENGIDAIIASGLESDVVKRILSNEKVGTYFKSKK